MWDNFFFGGIMLIYRDLCVWFVCCVMDAIALSVSNTVLMTFVTKNWSRWWEVGWLNRRRVSCGYVMIISRIYFARKKINRSKILCHLDLFPFHWEWLLCEVENLPLNSGHGSMYMWSGDGRFRIMSGVIGGYRKAAQFNTVVRRRSCI